MFLRLFLVCVVIHGILGEKTKKDTYLYWESNKAGLFSHFLQFKMMYAYAATYNKGLAIADVKSVHYGFVPISMCDFFDLSEYSVFCYKKVPSQITCSKKLPVDYMEKDTDICYNGPFLFNLMGAQTVREAIVNAVNIEIPLKLHKSTLSKLSEMKSALGISPATEYSVVHWRRGDQLGRERCGGGIDTSVNCDDGAALVQKIKQVTKHSIVYVATNENQTSFEMDVVRKAGYKTLLDLDGGRFLEMDMLSILAMEVTLMLEATSFYAWGISEVDDVVEYERKQAGRSHCLGHEPFNVVGNITWCSLLHNDMHKVDGEKKPKGSRKRSSSGVDLKSVTFGSAKKSSSSLADTPGTAPHSSTSSSSNRPNKREATVNSSLAVLSRIATEYGDTGFLLNKTAFSDRTRVLLIAGLEGTGHHAMASMFRICRKRKLCEPDSLLSQQLMMYSLQESTMYGLFGAAGGEQAIEDISEVEESLTRLQSAAGNHLYFVGLQMALGVGMMSYPNFNGRQKSLDHPDVFALATIAESVGVDFRVVVLQRSGKDVIASTSKRGFGGRAGTVAEPKILIDNAAAMYSQLSMLDRKFFHCVDYKQLGSLDEAQKSEFMDFLHPQNMPPVFEDMLKEIRYSNSSSPSSSSSSSKGGHGHRRLVSADEHDKNLLSKYLPSPDEAEREARKKAAEEHDQSILAKFGYDPKEAKSKGKGKNKGSSASSNSAGQQGGKGSSQAAANAQMGGGNRGGNSMQGMQQQGMGGGNRGGIGGWGGNWGGNGGQQQFGGFQQQQQQQQQQRQYPQQYPQQQQIPPQLGLRGGRTGAAGGSNNPMASNMNNLLQMQGGSLGRMGGAGFTRNSAGDGFVNSIPPEGQRGGSRPGHSEVYVPMESDEYHAMQLEARLALIDQLCKKK